MAKILPLGGDVDWPEDEGVLGVVGVAPWATIEFLRAFYALVPATKDWHFPRVITDTNTKLPSRGRYFQLGERDPSPYIAENIRELADLGATVIVLPCNTAHLLYDRWAVNAAVPVPNIVEETVALAHHEQAKLVTPFTSTSLADFDLYGAVIEKQGMACHRLSPEDQSLVSQLLEEVKVHSVVGGANLERLDRLCSKLRLSGVDTILLGCTELTSLMPRFAKHGLKVFDSNQALAGSAFRLVMGKQSQTISHTTPSALSA
ncbi:aspartate/glutamate racemase family protein [Rhizobium sp. CG4]|jgi:aspartate racemase|uniref:aspartate/glutamate racemase family protein n=1 Tax=Rhizobium sp. CG4 TaxID=2726075 RepID=UPI002034A589|nr:amino acid racemase [Rhizobium sp. CG4]MCM2455915.1 aspartate/glutamate racemase family protein [Rhizobium sp. CG4]